MKRAWPTDTQKPRARIRLVSTTLSRRWRRTIRTRASSAVIEPLELRHVVVASPPRQLREVEWVRDSEVVEGHQQVRLERVPEPQLDCGSPVEEGAHVESVRALGRCGQAQQFDGSEVVEEPAVGGCLGVVELVDHDNVEVIGAEARRRVAAARRCTLAKTWRHRSGRWPPRRAHRRPHPPSTSRYVRSDCSRISWRCATNSRDRAPCSAQPLVVECSDHRLAGPRRRHHEVAVSVVHLALDLRADRASPSDGGKGERQAPRWRSWYEGPSGLRPPRARRRAVRRRGPGHRARRLGPASTCRRWPRTSSAAPGCACAASRTFHSSPSRRAARLRLELPTYAVLNPLCAAEQPGLRMQARAPRFVIHADLGAEVAHESVERRSIGSAHVGRGEDPQRHAAVAPVLKLSLEHPQPVPLDEGAEQIHPVRRRQLRAELIAELWVTARVGQQRRP